MTRRSRARQDVEPEAPATGSGAPVATEKSLEQALGAQVRRLRRQHEITAAELAAAAHLSTGMLSKIENGQISPSLGTIQSLAAALHVPISSLFTGFDERRDCSYVRANQGVVIERRGTKVGHIYELLGHALGGELVMEPYRISLRDEAAPYTAFQHSGLEFLYMLSGEVVYRHADRTYRLAPGDALMFDSAAPHGPEEFVRRPIEYLSIIIYPRPS